MNQQGAMPTTPSSNWGRRLLPGAAPYPGLLLGLFIQQNRLFTMQNDFLTDDTFFYISN